MIEVVVSFWVIVFSLRALLSKNARNAVEAMFVSLLMITFYFYYAVDGENIKFFIPLFMILGLLLSTYFLDTEKRGDYE